MDGSVFAVVLKNSVAVVLSSAEVVVFGGLVVFSLAMLLLGIVVRGMVASGSVISALGETLVGILLCFVGEVLSV